MLAESTTAKVYALIDAETGRRVSVYMGPGGRGEQMYFDSPSSARNSNCHGVYLDLDKYDVRAYELTETITELADDLPLDAATQTKAAAFTNDARHYAVDFEATCKQFDTECPTVEQLIDYRVIQEMVRICDDLHPPEK